MGSDFNLTDYLCRSIGVLVKDTLKACFENPKETAFILRYMKAVDKAGRIRENYEKQGRHIPPFLIASITSNCNLFCKGCYARENNLCSDKAEKIQLTGDEWSRIFIEAEKIGVSFILLAGGEPFMRPDIIERASEIPGILFPVFTNGTLLNEEKVEWLDSHRNILPVVSIEGGMELTDERRGSGTYAKIKKVMRFMHERQLLYGASITVTKENIITVTADEFINDLRANGCRIVFYIEYVPVSKDTENLAPGDNERIYLDLRVNSFRKTNKNVTFVAFPGDEKSTGGCLAAGRGFFHINPSGDAEPCPFSPYSDTNLANTGLLEALDSPFFNRLNQSGILLEEHLGGCVLFNRRKEIPGISFP